MKNKNGTDFPNRPRTNSISVSFAHCEFYYIIITCDIHRRMSSSLHLILLFAYGELLITQIKASNNVTDLVDFSELPRVNYTFAD
jgi:hypothetical protein